MTSLLKILRRSLPGYVARIKSIWLVVTVALCKNESYFPSNSGATGEKPPRLPGHYYTDIIYRDGCDFFMAVRAKFMCNMWRIRAKEEAKVMAIRGRGKKRRKRSLKGNHGTTHNGVMSATRVVSKKTTTKYYNCRDLCGGKYVPVFNWISLTLGPISLSWDLVSNIFPISIIANKFVVKKKIYIYIHVHNICDVDNLSG